MKPSPVARRRRRAADSSIQGLEPRCLLSATLANAIPNQTVITTQAATTVTLGSYFDDPAVPGTAVEIQTPKGSIPIALSPSTPLTDTNFLNYINSGEYADTITSRSISNFIIQGGGYTPDGTHIATFAPVAGEPGLSNTTGTIAMALPSGATSASSENGGTSEWFINLANNTNLNTAETTQNGSVQGPFTVFGDVVYNGMSVVDSIAALPTVDDVNEPAAPYTGAWANLPLIGYTGTSGAQVTSVPSTDLVTNTTVIVPALTYAATSSNTNLVTASITNGVLSLTPAAGLTSSGEASVTVTATDLGGGTATSQFFVNISNGHTLSVAIGTGQAKSAAYTDPDGTTATVTLRGPGVAEVNFAGDGLTQTATARGVAVAGSDLSLASIATSGTSSASVLTITTRGGTRSVAIGGILTDNLRQLSATGVALTGNLTSTGSIATVSLGSAVDGTVAATTIGTLLTSGAFSDNLTVGAGATAVNRFSAGSIGGGTWGVTGSINTITAGSVTAWNAGITQSVRSIVVSHGDFNGVLTAGSVGAFTVRGSILNSTFNVSGAGLALRTLSATGAISGSMVNALAGNLGTILAGSLLNSMIFAGVGSTFPASVAGFAGTDSIGSVILRKPPAIGDAFTNSQIAASQIGTLSLRTLSTAAPSVAAQHIRLFSGTANKAFALVNLTGATNLTSLLAAKAVVLGDFLTLY